LKDFFQIVCCAAAWLALPAGSASAASAGEVSGALMQGAECMAALLRTAPGVMDVRISVPAGSGTAYPVIQYSYADRFGGRRFTEVSLFELTGAQDSFVFDWEDVDGDPAAQKLLTAWKSKCHVDGGYITSVPG
jgi:hypothetical protein